VPAELVPALLLAPPELVPPAFVGAGLSELQPARNARAARIAGAAKCEEGSFMNNNDSAEATSTIASVVVRSTEKGWDLPAILTEIDSSTDLLGAKFFSSRRRFPVR